LLHDFFLLAVELGDSVGRRQELVQVCVGEFPGEGVDGSAHVDEVDGGDGLDLEDVGDLSEFIDVDLEEFEFAVGSFDALFESRGELLAGDAPVRVEIDEERH
jgi:hypothetical protein